MTENPSHYPLAGPVEISVVLCTYNRADSLKLVLDDLEKQDGSPDLSWEIVVIDNNSNDHTKEIVESFKRKTQQQVVYHFEPEQGLSVARNSGIKIARGKIIAFTDDDVRILEKWVQSIKNTFDRYACIGMGGPVLPRWSIPQPSWLVLEGPYRMLGVVVMHNKGEETRPYDDSMYTPIGANMAFHRWAFDKYGGFRTDIGRIGNVLLSGAEVEFCKRLMKNGEKIIYQADSKMLHPVDPVRVSKNYFRKWYFFKGKSMPSRREDQLPGVTYFNVPKYIFRQLVENLAGWLTSTITFRREKAFYYQLQICYFAGQVNEYFKRRTEPIR